MINAAVISAKVVADKTSVRVDERWNRRFRFAARSLSCGFVRFKTVQLFIRVGASFRSYDKQNCNIVSCVLSACLTKRDDVRWELRKNTSSQSLIDLVTLSALEFMTIILRSKANKASSWWPGSCEWRASDFLPLTIFLISFFSSNRIFAVLLSRLALWNFSWKLDYG